MHDYVCNVIVATVQAFAANRDKVLSFVRFLHLSGLVVHYGQERVSQGVVERASATSNKPVRGIVIRKGAIIEADGSARQVKLSDTILRTVFLQVCARACLDYTCNP